MREQAMQMLRSPFARFLITGGIAAAVNLSSRILFSLFMPFRWAVVAAYLVGMTTAWVLSRSFVFETSGRSRSEEFMRFSIVNVFAALQVWLISVGLAEWAFPRWGMRFHPEELAHLVGVLVPVFTSYAGHKYFSFAKART